MLEFELIPKKKGELMPVYVAYHWLHDEQEYEAIVCAENLTQTHFLIHTLFAQYLDIPSPVTVFSSEITAQRALAPKLTEIETLIALDKIQDKLTQNQILLFKKASELHGGVMHLITIHDIPAAPEKEDSRSFPHQLIDRIKSSLILPVLSFAVGYFSSASFRYGVAKMPHVYLGGLVINTIGIYFSKNLQKKNNLYINILASMTPFEVTIKGPVQEELIFRLGIYNALKYMLTAAYPQSTGVAMIVSSMLFGLAHKFNPIQIASNTYVGGMMCLVYESRGLAASLGLHMAINSVGYSIARVSSNTQQHACTFSRESPVYRITAAPFGDSRIESASRILSHQ
jgi:membrane protease YdiL (CAAX protease family)